MHRTLQTTETVPKSTTVGKRGCQHDWRREEAMPRLALTRLRSLAGTVKLRVAASFAGICITILTLLTFALQPWRTCVSRARARDANHHPEPGLGWAILLFILGSLGSF